MATNITDQIKSLHDSKLHEDVKYLCSFTLTLSENNPQLLTVNNKHDILIYYAEALITTREFTSAQAQLEKALSLKKGSGKGRARQDADQDVRWLLYQCHMAQQDYSEAAAVLEAIPPKSRTAAAFLALGGLHERSGQDRSAITCFKEALRLVPMSLTASQGLLRLGLKVTEVAQMMTMPVGCSDWLSLWLKSQSNVVNKDLREASATMAKLNCRGQLLDNPYILEATADLALCQGHTDQCSDLLEQLHSLYPHWLSSMDTYAYCLYRNNRRAQLQQLTAQLMKGAPQGSQAWVAAACLVMVAKKMCKAAIFSQKALTYSPDCVEGHMVRGLALCQTQCHVALGHFREVLRLKPCRYDAHQGIVDCYLGGGRVREAVNYATQTCKSLGMNAPALTIMGIAMSRDPNSMDKAKSYLEKAINMDQQYLKPVYALVDIHWQQQQYSKGLTLLHNTLKFHSTSRLHQLAGDFLLAGNGNLQEALDHYSIALSQDPANLRAKEGKERAEKHLYLPLESTQFEVEVENDSDNDLEGSEVESTWSDLDVNIMT